MTVVPDTQGVGVTTGGVLDGDVVHLEIAALPAQVRTARLLTSAVARRAGIDPGLLDEVRLAVGEATARAVELHARHDPHCPVELDLSWAGHVLTAVVRDRGPVEDLPADDGPPALGAEVAEASQRQDDTDDDAGLPTGLGLGLVQGLVDDVTVEQPPGGGTAVTMRWPLDPA